MLAILNYFGKRNTIDQVSFIIKYSSIQVSLLYHFLHKFWFIKLIQAE